MDLLNGDMLYEIQKMLSVREWGRWRCVSKRHRSSTVKDAARRAFSRVLKQFDHISSLKDLRIHVCEEESGWGGICDDDDCTCKKCWFSQNYFHYYYSVSADTDDDESDHIIHSIEYDCRCLAYRGAYYNRKRACWILPNIEDVFTHLNPRCYENDRT